MTTQLRVHRLPEPQWPKRPLLYILLGTSTFKVYDLGIRRINYFDKLHAMSTFDFLCGLNMWTTQEPHAYKTWECGLFTRVSLNSESCGKTSPLSIVEGLADKRYQLTSFCLCSIQHVGSAGPFQIRRPTQKLES